MDKRGRLEELVTPSQFSGKPCDSVCKEAAYRKGEAKEDDLLDERKLKVPLEADND